MIFQSKFDDYYVFKLPAKSGNNDLEKLSSARGTRTDTITTGENIFSHFSITRPMEEGTAPSIENGFDAFDDVRGDSGTRVTIKLNQAAIDAGFLKEEEVLKPLLGKFLQASPYTVILDKCCTDEQRKEIVEATAREQDDSKRVQAENSASIEDDNEDLEDVPQSESHKTVKERASFIPIRLSMGGWIVAMINF